MKISTVVKVHFFRERLDVLIAVLAPLALMAESGYANAWTFAGGQLGFDLNSANAFVRGFFLEGLIFAMFKLVRHLSLQLTRRVQVMKDARVSRFDRVLACLRGLVVILIPGMIGLIGMVVSAGCNLGWATHSGEMVKVVTNVSAFLPGPILEVFKIGLGLLFPVAVGAFALFDLTHLVQDMFNSLKFQEKVIIAEKAELHIKNVKREAKAAATQMQGQYKDYCVAEAQSMVDGVKRGDRSFGLNALYDDEKKSGVSKVVPLQIASPASAFLPASNRRGAAPGAGPMGPPAFPASGAGQRFSSPVPDPVSDMPTINIDASGSPHPRPNRGAPRF